MQNCHGCRSHSNWQYPCWDSSHWRFTEKYFCCKRRRNLCFFLFVFLFSIQNSYFDVEICKLWWTWPFYRTGTDDLWWPYYVWVGPSMHTENLQLRAFSAKMTGQGDGLHGRAWNFFIFYLFCYFYFFPHSVRLKWALQSLFNEQVPQSKGRGEC